MTEPVRLGVGEHLFVYARPKVKDWSQFDGRTLEQGREEFRPCMIAGQNLGQRLWVIGSQFAHELIDFELSSALPKRVLTNNLPWASQNENHVRLLNLMAILPTDYTDYGGEVERWADDNLAYPDCSGGCRWAEWLGGEHEADWCVCGKPGAPRAGLLTFEHMTGQGCFEGFTEAEAEAMLGLNASNEPRSLGEFDPEEPGL